MSRACSYGDCGRPSKCRGLCSMHYQRMVNGTPAMDAPARLVLIGKTAAERFWARVEVAESGCWIWTGAKAAGYGRLLDDDRRIVGTHRFAYDLLVGPIPDGLHLDHLCRTPACCNPAHLEPVTHAENLRRGDGPSAENARRTHCVHGHEFDEKNTYWWHGARSCKACWRDRRAAKSKARKATR